MAVEPSEIWVIGGCNGSGKTTFALNIFSNLGDIEFINANMIAAQLNPNNPDAVAFQANEMMLERLWSLVSTNQSFAFETTFAKRLFSCVLRQAKDQGYRVNLIYLWLNSEKLASTRVALRKASGVHNIPDVSCRSYFRSRKNFLTLYSELADYWIVYDNTKPQRELIAEKVPEQSKTTIYQAAIWQQIKKGVS